MPSTSLALAKPMSSNRRKEHRRRTAQQWMVFPHAIMDNKVFPVFLSGKARDLAARRSVRGAYRGRAASVTQYHTKPSKCLKQNMGPSVMITCAIGNGKVLMWHEVKGRWNAEAAAKMYTGPLSRSLRRAYPSRRAAWRIMEDNDPTGYKSGKAVLAKRAARMAPLSFPRRSPDLNPLDYSVWAEINRRMREQESKWPYSKRESRREYLRRLRRTAMSLPKAFIDKAIGNMRHRLRQVEAARGGHFPEGGAHAQA